MNTKEIHDNLLSLFLRGLGVWLLYLATGWFLRFWDTLWAHVTGGYIDWYASFFWTFPRRCLFHPGRSAIPEMGDVPQGRDRLDFPYPDLFLGAKCALVSDAS
jgi:hypothetical protein